MIFDYPDPRQERRHGPAGYATHKRYRPWLRDEFDFRCVYCLKRETWGQITSDFEIDHFKPQSLNPELRLGYLNLVYDCRRCNAIKGAQTVADPFRLLQSTLVATPPHGSLRAHGRDTRRLIRQLELDCPKLRSWRAMWMGIAASVKETNRDLYLRVVGPPVDLPDLSRLGPPRNTREEGLEHSRFARRQRGFLPEEY